MCKKMMCLMTLILILGLSSTALATTYYVSPSGNDNNSGTSPSDAWKTIDKVNSVTFSTGDSILFEGGETFTGQLDFTSGGTPTSPITVSSYGTGRATLSNPTMGVENSPSTGLRIYNCAGFEINDLILVGPGNEGDRWGENVGIRLHADLGTAGARVDYIRIDNVEISNYAGYGIYAYGVAYSGFRDVQITNSLFHHIGKEGICCEGSEWPLSQSSHNDFYIGDCVMYMVTGVGTRGPHSGSGINLSALDGGLIEFNQAYDCGSWCEAEGGGPLGIWCWETENAVFQFNEVHHQQTSGGDGGGYDLDGGSSYCTVQYSYSHDNFGGNLLMQFSRSRSAHDYIFRYNISSNDCQFNGMGAVTFYSDSSNQPYDVDVYNNTFYVGPDSQPGASAIDIWVWHGSYSNVNLRNNIFMAEAGKRLIAYDTLGGFTFQNNLYWQSGVPLVITDGSTTYTSLDAWRTATGQEMLDGSPVGMELSPQLADVHDHPVLGPHNLPNLSGYKLKSTSQCRDSGLDLQSLFGIDPGTRDYYGNTIPQGSLFDISAHEYPGGGSAPEPDTTAPSAPSGLTATAVSFKQIDLDWSNNTEGDMSHYSVKRSTSAGGPYTQIISNLNASAYSDKGVMPSTTYYYVVSAVDTSSNESGNSSESSATTDTYPGSLIFSDGYESGDFAAGGWETGGAISVDGSAAYTGSYGAEVGKQAIMNKALSTTGYTDIRVRYMRKLVKGHQSSNTLMVRWADGPREIVHPIESIGGDVPWGQTDVFLSSVADNNPNFKLYFRETAVHPGANYACVDDVEIWGVGGVPDTDPPSPDPMTWATVPYATGSSSITMVATTATDASGVEYYFDCLTTGGHDSAWQNSTSYEDTGLSPETTYTYQVKARDKSPNKNETGWSTQKSATTEPEAPPDTTPPTPDPMTWATLPYATGSSSIAMVATTATDPSGVEYYFDETSGNPGGTDSGWQDSTSYEDTGLDPSTQYCYKVQARDKSANQNATGWSTTECATTQEPGAEIYVYDIAMSWYEPKGGYYAARTTVWIKDVSLNDISGATVTGEWSGATTKGDTSGDTGVDGKITIESDDVKGGGTYTFCVTNVTATGYTYNSSLNNETCDSITAPEADTTPPSPDPMTWATVPYATGSSSIAMVATTASDPSGVEYYFDCTTTGGHDSGWQSSTSYEDTGLSPETTYTYQVKARDKSANQNETGWSTQKSATTEPEAPPDTTPPSPDPMTWATVPYATGSSSIAMVATTATDESGVEYYFDETSGNPGGSDSGWQDSTSYTDTGLDPDTQYCYQVQARDKSPNQNATGWSTTECATTEAEAPPDTTPPSPDPMTWATVPYATGTTSIAMVATTATDESGVEYYFDCTTAGGHDSGWQDSTSYEDTGLSPETTYTYRVQARDKSPNQNATGWSTSKSATTEAGGPVIFSDGFESGNFSAGGWTTGGQWTGVKDTVAYTGTYGAQIRGNSWIEKAVSTSGYTGIHVKYARETDSMEAGEYLYAEWYDGSSWYELEAVTNADPWTVKDWALGSGANNNPDFKIRFRTDGGNAANDKGNVDDVEVSGS